MASLIGGPRFLTTFHSAQAVIEGTFLAKPNYQFEKRQRDLAKKNKQEEKRRQKLANKAAENDSPEDTDESSSPDTEGAPDSGKKPGEA